MVREGIPILRFLLPFSFVQSHRLEAEWTGWMWLFFRALTSFERADVRALLRSPLSLAEREEKQERGGGDGGVEGKVEEGTELRQKVANHSARPD